MTQHGTDSCYILGCRREECRAAHRAKEAERRAQRRIGGTSQCGAQRTHNRGICTFELLPGTRCPWHG